MRRMLAALGFAAAALSLSSAEEQGAAVRGFSQIGIGVGRTYRGDEDGGLGSPLFSFGFDSRVGMRLGEHGALFLYTGIVIHDVATGVDYTRWVFQDDEYLVLKAFSLSWLIPAAFLLDSHVMAGPGITFYTSAQAPAAFVEVGGGLSSNQSVAHSYYAFGSGLFGGAGVQITDHVGVLLRVLWAPSSLASRWTSSDGDALSLLAMLQLH
jgi:hypothetical protein